MQRCRLALLLHRENLDMYSALLEVLHILINTLTVKKRVEENKICVPHSN